MVYSYFKCFGLKHLSARKNPLFHFYTIEKCSVVVNRLNMIILLYNIEIYNYYKSAFLAWILLNYL